MVLYDIMNGTIHVRKGIVCNFSDCVVFCALGSWYSNHKDAGVHSNSFGWHVCQNYQQIRDYPESAQSGLWVFFHNNGEDFRRKETFTGSMARLHNPASWSLFWIKCLWMTTSILPIQVRDFTAPSGTQLWVIALYVWQLCTEADVVSHQNVIGRRNNGIVSCPHMSHCLESYSYYLLP